MRSKCLMLQLSDSEADCLRVWWCSPWIWVFKQTVEVTFQECCTCTGEHVVKPEDFHNPSLILCQLVHLSCSRQLENGWPMRIARTRDLGLAPHRLAPNDLGDRAGKSCLFWGYNFQKTCSSAASCHTEWSILKVILQRKEKIIPSPRAHRDCCGGRQTLKW